MLHAHPAGMGSKITVSRKPVGRVALSPGATVRKCGRTYIGTLDRWLEDGVQVVPDASEPKEPFPKPDLVIGRIRHWYDVTIDAFQDRCAARLAEWQAKQSGNRNSAIPPGREPEADPRRPDADNAAAPAGDEPGAPRVVRAKEALRDGTHSTGRS
jgi:hypothetical protein